MSYSLERPRAVLLFADEGLWSLEVEALVRLNRNTFRPRRRRLSGRDAILQHLAVNQGGLVGATKQLLDGGLGGDTCRFEARGEGWVPAPELQDVPREEYEDPGVAAEHERALVGEIVQLRERVAKLEGVLANLSGRPGALGDAGAVGAAGGASAGASAGAGPEVAVAAADAEAPKEALPTPDFKPLKVPGQELLLSKVQGLTDESVQMTKEDPTWDLLASGAGYVGVLRDDDGETLGALVMDLEATVRLSGAMMMEEADSLQAQIDAGQPTEDIMDAAGEVLNTLTSAINKVSGNKHVRVSAIAPLAEDAEPWLRQPRERADFSFSIGGRLAFVAR